MRELEQRNAEELQAWKSKILERVRSSDFHAQLKKSVVSAVSCDANIAKVKEGLPELKKSLFDISSEADFMSDVLFQVRRIFTDATEIYLDPSFGILSSSIEVGVTSEGNQAIRDRINPPKQLEIAKPKGLLFRIFWG